VLSWALEHNLESGERLVWCLIELIRGLGGFRSTSPNFVGAEAIRNAAGAFRVEGFELSEDGELRPLLLDQLSSTEMTEALWAYVRRAQRGAEDAALVVGTGKDLLEATARHVLVQFYGAYAESANFPTTLGQAFAAAGLATPADPMREGEPAQRQVERILYQLGCVVNTLRNREGTGHGKPFLPTVSEEEAKLATECMGIVSAKLLMALKAG